MMMRKSYKTILLVVAIAMIAGGFAVAQDAEQDPEQDLDREVELGEDVPEFVRGMFEIMARDEWTGRELSAFVTAARAQNWDNVEDANPEMVMNAFRYAHEHRGTNGEEFSGEAQAEFALELAEQAQEMRRLGMDNREIARATTSATRNTIRTMTRERVVIDGEQIGEELRTRLRAETGEEMREMARDRMRENESGRESAAERGGDRGPQDRPAEAGAGRPAGAERTGDRPGPAARD
ncbi:MAG: hypothetical protein PF508_20460 [Spirochaeta sp.]|jgi:hypothetical protein|nr:hypothetical protein [Spirochaeta sp.]